MGQKRGSLSMVWFVKAFFLYRTRHSVPRGTRSRSTFRLTSRLAGKQKTGQNSRRMQDALLHRWRIHLGALARRIRPCCPACGESAPVPCSCFSSGPNPPLRSQVGLSPKKAHGRGARLEDCPERSPSNPLVRLRAMAMPGDLARQECPNARAPRKYRDALAQRRYCAHQSSGCSGARASRHASLWSPPFLTLRRWISSPWRRGSGSAGRGAPPPPPSRPAADAALTPGDPHRARARCTHRLGRSSPSAPVAGVDARPGHRIFLSLRRPRGAA